MIAEKFNRVTHLYEREREREDRERDFLFTVLPENKYNINVLKPQFYAYPVSNFILAWLAGLLTCIFTTAKNNEESK